MENASHFNASHQQEACYPFFRQLLFLVGPTTALLGRDPDCMLAMAAESAFKQKVATHSTNLCG